MRLTGGTIELARYRFRLPAGFKSSSSVCQFSLPAAPGQPTTVLNSFAVAASAHGGCLQALVIAGGSPVPAGADPVAVGPYSGFLVSPGPSQEDLYVEIPTTEGDRYLTLLAQGLTADQLVAIAASGLPASLGAGDTCTASCG